MNTGGVTVLAADRAPVHLKVPRVGRWAANIV